MAKSSAAKKVDEIEEEEIEITETPPGDAGSDPKDVALESEPDDEDDDVEGHATGGEVVVEDEEDTEAKRAARREERKRRKELHRQKEAESKRLIASQAETIRRMEERLALTERRQSGFEASTLDQHIAQAESVVEKAKQVMAQAIAKGDGETHAKAMEIMYEHRKRADDLRSHKQQMIENSKHQQVQQQIAPDPVLARRARQWADANPWYNTEVPRQDADSRVAHMLSGALVEEGFDPKTEEYWDELNERIKKYLPHRVKQSDKPAPKQAPKVITGGSSRDAAPAGKKTFYLSPERVKAIKDANAWDDPVRRNRMVKSFMEYDKIQASKK